MVSEFPAFKAGDGTWIVASDGQCLMVKGLVRRAGSQTQNSVYSLIPILALASADASRGAGGVLLNVRVWDGEEHTIGVEGASRQDVAGIQALVALVQRNNTAWPLSASRAAAARRQLSVGYLRDRSLLGPQGLEEFWSPLAELPWEWPNLWRQSDCASKWPLAAVQTHCPEPAIACLLEDALVILNEEGELKQLPFSALHCPHLVTGQAPEASIENVHRVAPCSLIVGTSEVPDIELSGFPREALQPFFRFILARWAEAKAAQGQDSLLAIGEAADQLDAGNLEAEAYAVLVDAIVARASGVSLFQGYPPRERDYLRPVPQPKPAARPTPPQVAAPAATPQRSGINARQVAAGATAGAALWSLFDG